MKVSVITVCFNSRNTIGDCLDSFARQTFRDKEHIIVDGASTDGTREYLESRSSELGVFTSEPDGGIYDAMNRGIQLSGGDIIGFLNSDDFYAHDSVLEAIERLFSEDPFLEACYTDLVYIDKSDISHVVRFWRAGSFAPGSFAKGWAPPHPTFFVRRSVFGRFGAFDTSYQIASDVDLMMRFLEVHKIRIRYLPEVSVKMRTGGVSNRGFRSVIRQNFEVLQSLKANGFSTNPLKYFLIKAVSRGLQFIYRPRSLR
jgi:glycosyltransferase involved in cell wall biosynthesis